MELGDQRYQGRSQCESLVWKSLWLLLSEFEQLDDIPVLDLYSTQPSESGLDKIWQSGDVWGAGQQESG